MDLKGLFDSWGKLARPDYTEKQWLLSKWEVLEGVEWPPAKVAIMIGTIADGLDLNPSCSLLDIGCGGGWILRALKPHCPNIVGVDFSRPMLGHARRFCPQETFVCGEIGHLPFRDHSWDRALSYFVFLNFLDDAFIEEGLRDILRVLRPGGRALIGQLPDQSRSRDYDQAKQEYLQYCRGTYKVGKSHREVCRAPQKLFDKERLAKFLEGERIDYQFRDSFNPFFRPGQPETVAWRFDLILKKI